MLIKINIDDEYERKIRIIQQVTHFNTSEIIEQALDFLYENIGIKENNNSAVN